MLRSAHTLWGGVFNPILSIGDANHAAQLVRLYEVDALFLAAEEPQLKVFSWERRLHAWVVPGGGIGPHAYPCHSTGWPQHSKRGTVATPTRLTHRSRIGIGDGPSFKGQAGRQGARGPMGPGGAFTRSTCPVSTLRKELGGMGHLGRITWSIRVTIAAFPLIKAASNRGNSLAGLYQVPMRTTACMEIFRPSCG